MHSVLDKFLRAAMRAKYLCSHAATRKPELLSSITAFAPCRESPALLPQNSTQQHAHHSLKSAAVSLSLCSLARLPASLERRASRR